MNAATKFLTKSVSGDFSKVTFTLGNGVQVVVAIGDLPDKIQKWATAHGISQKIGDAAAGFSKANDFHGAFSAMQSVADALLEGELSVRGNGGVSDLAEAMRRVFEAQGRSVPLERIQEAIRSYDESQLKEKLANKAVKAALLEIKRERLEAASSEADLEL